MILGKTYKLKLIFSQVENEDDINACFTRSNQITGIKMLHKLYSTMKVGQALSPLVVLGLKSVSLLLDCIMDLAVSWASFSSFSFLRPF